MNDKDFNPAQQSSYQTGRTTPPKSHSGLIALLLAIIILLGGMVTVLSLLNIRLFHALKQTPEKSAIVFAEKVSATREENAGLPSLGISGKDISSTDQLYFRIPLGVYITDVVSGSKAEIKGIQPGDILLSLDGVKVPNINTLTNTLSGYKAGDTVTLVLHRDGNEFSVDIVLEE